MFFYVKIIFIDTMRGLSYCFKSFVEILNLENKYKK